MKSSVGFLRKRRQAQLAMWTEGARLYLQLMAARPARTQTLKPLEELRGLVENLRQSSGFGKRARQTVRHSFTGQLMDFMRRHNRTPVMVARAAGIPKALMAEILSDRHYRPNRELAILLAIAVHLTVGETETLLAHADYTLSHQSPQDVVVEYFLRLRMYRLKHINEVLSRLDIPILSGGNYDG